MKATTIKEIRQITNLSQGKFAERYGIPVRTLQGWECGKGTPPPYVLKWLERIVREDFPQAE